MKYLVDTSVLLRYLSVVDEKHGAVTQEMRKLLESGVELIYTPQVERETWAVMTRPASVNGLGLQPEEAKSLLAAAKGVVNFQPDTSEIHEIWGQLVVRHQVKGKQVHDANPVAAMKTHGISVVLTLDKRDFDRYEDVKVIFPATQ